MFSRFRIAIGLALLLAFVIVIPVFAGGWAVITLDSLPAGVVAGQPLTVGFTVLQHGRTPMTGLDPTITANLHKAEQFVVHAVSEGKPGHYTATLTFPKEGEWEWSIQAFTMDQPMPLLNVAAPVAGSKADKTVKTEPVPFVSLLWIIRALALGIGAIAFIISLRRQSRLAVTLTAFCLFVVLGSFVIGSGAGSRAEAQADSSSKISGDASMSQAELGQQLFIAKGCITCHLNSKVARDPKHWTIPVGPDLSNFSANAEVLIMRLKDPASVKSDTKMPNLGLREEEIEALVAFINSK